MKINKNIPLYLALAAFTIINSCVSLYGAHVSSSVALLLLVISVTWIVLAGRKRLEFRAHYDTLTKLPNRASFYDHLAERIKTNPADSVVHVLLMDLNRFKHVNDTLGHPVGDQLLVQSTERLRSCFRKDDFIARLGGDEFAVVMGGSAQLPELEPILKRVVKAFTEHFHLGEYEVDVGMSVGLATYPTDGQTADDVVKRADIAMYIAKEERRGYVVYTADRELDVFNVVELPVDFKQAIQNRELEVFYQPKKSLKTGKIVGVEALVRWNHPKYGLVQPMRFLPIVEQIGMIGDVTLYVLEESLKQYKEWVSRGLDISISVNTSADDLGDSSKITQLARLLFEQGVNPNKLILEVTETAIMSNPEETLKLLVVLDAMGVRLSVDDFGTGHASLTYLKNLPIKELKIEHMFVKDMVRNKQDYNIVASTIILGQMAGCQVVAEGVEDSQTEDMLRALDCEIVQGYHICQPLPAKQVTDFMLKFNDVEQKHG